MKIFKLTAILLAICLVLSSCSSRKKEEENDVIEGEGNLSANIEITPVIPESSESSSSETQSESSVDPSTGSENQPESQPSSESSSEQQSASEPEQPVVDDGTEGETVAGIFVYKGIAFELFGGSKSAAEYYASVVNKYGDAFGSGVQVYNMVIPKHAELYDFPRKYQNISNSEKDSIDYIYSMLDSDVKSVDAYSVLEAHKDEYLYFNTDHHWTGLGAYYAYTAFMDAAGLDYYDYNGYNTCERFLRKKSFRRKTAAVFIHSVYYVRADLIIELHKCTLS